MKTYFDDWMVYTLLKYHIQWLRLMLKRCRHIFLSLNIKKCICTTPIETLIGHVISKDGIKVNMGNIQVILDLKPPVNQKKIKIFLGHTGYYKRFSRHYSDITCPIDEIINKYVPFIWSKECNESFQFLKKKLVESPIIKFLDWSK